MCEVDSRGVELTLVINSKPENYRRIIMSRPALIEDWELVMMKSSRMKKRF